MLDLKGITIRCMSCHRQFSAVVCSSCGGEGEIPSKGTDAIRGLLEVIDRELEKSGCDRSDLPQSSQARIKAATEAIG